MTTIKVQPERSVVRRLREQAFYDGTRTKVGFAAAEAAVGGSQVESAR